MKMEVQIFFNLLLFKKTVHLFKQEINKIEKKPVKKINCVLCLDAFSCTFLLKKKIKGENDEMKSVFIYMILPNNYKYKPFIINKFQNN